MMLGPGMEGKNASFLVILAIKFESWSDHGKPLAGLNEFMSFKLFYALICSFTVVFLSLSLSALFPLMYSDLEIKKTKQKTKKNVLERKKEIVGTRSCQVLLKKSATCNKTKADFFCCSWLLFHC